MQVSVIIPNYNHSAYLPKRINSVLDQTYKDYEVIILDDHSSDNSREVIETVRNNPQVSKIIYNEQNSGSTFHQWEKGIALAKGKYIWIAESDDFCDCNFLEVTVKALEADESAALAYVKTLRVDEQDQVIGDLSFWYDDLSKTKWQTAYTEKGITEIKKYLVIKNTIPNASAVLFRKAALGDFPKEVLGFKLSGDWFFWVRVIHNHNVKFLVDTTNYFRTHTNSVRNTIGKTELIESEAGKIRKYMVSLNLITEKEIIHLLKSHGKISFLRKIKRKLRSIITNVITGKS